MNRVRRIASAFWLALALLLGQHAAALHDLGHASEQLSQKKESRHAPASCDKCFAFAELSGALGATAPAVPVVFAGGDVPFTVLTLGAPSAARLAYRSRAPPASLV
jgi:hypothetical protein